MTKWHRSKKRYALGNWQPWFAWRPVRAKFSTGDVPQPYDASWRWAWWEWVERRYDKVKSYETAYNEYRVGL